MAKYYVKSGTLEVIVSQPNAAEAAICGLSLTNKFDTIDEHFYVDERGYRDYVSADPKTNVLSTKLVAKAAGWTLGND